MTLEEVKLFLVQGSIVVKTGAASEGTPNGKKRPSSEVSFGDNVKISLSKVHQLPWLGGRGRGGLELWVSSHGDHEQAK